MTRGATFADNLALCWASAKHFCCFSRSFSFSHTISFSVLQNGIMAQPTFSLAYTSVRADVIPIAVETWRRTASGKHTVEVVIAVDGNNLKAIEYAKHVPDAKIVIQDEPPYNSVRGWNLAAAATTGKVILAIADDFKPCQDWDEKLFTLKTGWIDEDWTAHTEDGYVHDLMVLAILTRVRYEKFGYLFYPSYESIFCLSPETPVWMGDITFKPIGDVAVGDAVIGSTRKFGARGDALQQRNFLSEAKVARVMRRESERVRVILDSGRELICTPDHFWAYKGDGRLAGSTAKVPGLALKNGPILVENGFIYGHPRVGRQLLHVIESTELPNVSVTEARELGWLAGIMDGEGTFPVISQSVVANPTICAEIERLLAKYGFSFSADDWDDSRYSKKTGRQHKQRVFTITGGKSAYVRFLNMVLPLKRTSPQALSRILKSRFTAPDRIMRIEPAGMGPVVCLKTSTKNFIAGGYLSHNCDTEFTEVAYGEGRVINAKHIPIEHLHPDCNKRPRDEVDLVHASKERWNRGEMLFNFRKHRNFPNDVKGAVKAEAARPSADYSKFAVYTQATRDDLCLREVVKRLFDEGIRNFFFCIPDEYWSGKSTPQGDIQQVLDAAEWLRSLGAKALAKIFCVSDYRFAGDSRIAVETRVRNDSLAWVRQNGFNQICVVDSDELWQIGSLALIKDIVDKSNPLAISLPMIPVVGFPGYPIQGATDRVISYVGQSCVFRDCRTPIGQVYNENRVIVYHFTSTRRTKEETREKHVQSGHFDDPLYDFEEFLNKVLPNIRPGYVHNYPNGPKGIHFFKNYQIWPAVRSWSKQEWESIPETIHPYMGKL